MMRYLIAAIAVSFVLENRSAAGLYESGEPADFVPRDGKVVAQPPDSFRLRLKNLLGISIDSPPTKSLREPYLAKRDELNARRRRLSIAELNVLGACYYRLLDYEGALSAWLEASRKEPRGNFAGYSNLALLHVARSEFKEARQNDAAARDLLPAVIPGTTREQSAWYFKVDNSLRKLVRQRAAEPRIPQDQLVPDDLFGVQFGTEDGGYQAGQIAAAPLATLPEDDLAIVQQLLVWLPHDIRLQWLLAELYNAHGDPGTALALLNDCLERGFHPKLLREHKQTLQDHFDSLREQAEQQDKEQKEKKRETFWLAVVIGSVLVAGLVIWQLLVWKKRIARRT